MAEISRQRAFDGFVKVETVDTGGPHPFEVVIATDSVAFLVHNSDKDEVLLVTQDRAPMIRPDNPDGTVVEAVAGRFDEDIGVNGLIIKELKEELGVDATEDQIEHLNNKHPLALSPGVLTERQYLAYVSVREDQIDPSMRRYGNLDEGESIIRRFVPVAELASATFADMKLFALVQWFLRVKAS